MILTPRHFAWNVLYPEFTMPAESATFGGELTKQVSILDMGMGFGGLNYSQRS
jgi:hypothetical protein